MALSHDELAQVSQLVNEIIAQRIPFGRDGMIVPGTYDPKDACVDVVLLDTMNNTDGDQPGVESRVPIATSHVDDAHGPLGGELVHLVPSQSGYTAHLTRQPGGGEGPQAPAGERWIQLRSPGDKDGYGATTLAYVRMMQNGGVGEIALLAGALFSLATAAGFGLTLDDAAKKATLQSPGGLQVILDDNAGEIMLGHSGLTKLDSIVTKTDLQNAINAILTNVQTGITTWAAKSLQGGSGAAPIPPFVAITAQGSSDTEAAE